MARPAEREQHPDQVAARLPVMHEQIVDRSAHLAAVAVAGEHLVAQAAEVFLA